MKIDFKRTQRLNSGREYHAAYGGVSAFTLFLSGIGDSSLIAVRSFNPVAILRMLALATLVLLVVSCSNITRFPVSTVTPAADIVAVRHHDANENTIIKITAKNLAAVDRIASPKKAYVVWIVTERDGARNIGKLLNRNSKTAKLETVIPNYSTEVFITAEEDGEAVTPSGIEISRIRFK